MYNYIQPPTANQDKRQINAQLTQPWETLFKILTENNSVCIWEFYLLSKAKNKILKKCEFMFIDIKKDKKTVNFLYALLSAKSLYSGTINHLNQRQSCVQWEDIWPGQSPVVWHNWPGLKWIGFLLYCKESDFVANSHNRTLTLPVLNKERVSGE